MDQIKQLQHIIATLEMVRDNPSVKVGSSNPMVVKAFLDGFATAAVAAGLSHDFDYIRRIVQKEKGFGKTGSLIINLRERGYAENKMATELIDVHVHTWKRILTEEMKKQATN